MLQTELVITISPSSTGEPARRVAWEAIARVLGATATFSADPNHPNDRETVCFPRNSKSLLVRVSADKYHTEQIQRNGVTMRTLIAGMCGVSPSMEGHLALHGDPVGLLSALIELEEEPVTALRDQYGLIEGRNSWRSADGLLVPVLEVVATSIGKLIGIASRSALFPGGKSWAIAFSSDLDVLEDDHLDKVLNFLEKHQVDQPTFMICAVDEAERTIRDVHYAITDARTLRITEPLRRSGVEIGLHGSYLAHDRVDRLARQKRKLEQVFEQKVRGHRSHFLRFSKPRSWLAQAQAGFDYDASLGYADLPGFRNGCASPIEYRLSNEQKIRVFSTTFIDQHLFWPARLDDHAFYATVDPLLVELGQTGGVITLDWHSYTLRGGNYEGWWDRLEYILCQANQAGAYIGGIGSVSDAYFGQSLVEQSVLIRLSPKPPSASLVPLKAPKRIAVACSGPYRGPSASEKRASPWPPVRQQTGLCAPMGDNRISTEQRIRRNLVDMHDSNARQLAFTVPASVKTGTGSDSVGTSSVESLASENYFNKTDVWAERPQVYQVQLRELLKVLLGTAPASVLDVGCGNGLIANSLPTYLDVTAVDISATALTHVRVAKRLASITALPFAAQSFDFVYCFDVIEHLSVENMREGLEELQRVAKKHVLVAVPLNEDIASNSVRCAKCGCRFHINGHLRSHDREWLERLPVTDDFERTAIYFSGDITVPPPNPIVELCWLSGILPATTKMNCPQCGSEEIAQAPSNDLSFDVTRVVNSFRSAEWAKRLPRGDSWCDRSEGVVLLTRKGQSAALPAPTGGTTQASRLEVDFANFLQAIETDFVPGSLWPRFKPGRGMKMGREGLARIDKESHQAFPTILRFPVLPRPGDIIEMDVSCDGEGAVSLFGIDGVSGAIVRLLEDQLVQGILRQRLTIEVNTAWALDRFGLALDVYVYGTACVHGIQYLPLVALPGIDLATVQPGFNLIDVTEPGGLPAYWTFHALAHGQLAVSVITRPESNQGAGLLLREFEKANRRNGELAHMLAQKQAESENLNVELERLKSLNEILSASSQHYEFILAKSPYFVLRRFAGRVIRGIKGKLSGLRKLASKAFFEYGRLNVEMALQFPSRWQPFDPATTDKHGSGPRLLIVSHMFPHPDQPGLGSFVLEQAQALQKAGVDVRVISGRPFWLTSHRSPFRLLGGLYNYVRLYAASGKRWRQVDGVPVQFLPYPVLGPFWSHGWAYRFAIGRCLRRSEERFVVDLIHAHTGYLDGMAARVLSSRLKVPYVITEHTGPFSTLMTHPIIHRATLRAMAGAARVVTVSSALRRDIASYMDLGPTVMRVIPNVVNVEQFHPPKIWQPQPIAPRILFVGYFVPIKNLPLLLAAFRQVRDARPGATLMLVGGGEVPEQQTELLASIDRLGLAGTVEVKSYVERHEVARLMREECDMLVLSSKSETFGCVVAEALASGKPAVVTPCGGPEDIVTASWMGEVCAINQDVQALVSAILAVSDRLHVFEPHRIRQSAIERFSSGAVALRLLELYGELAVKPVLSPELNRRNNARLM